MALLEIENLSIEDWSLSGIEALSISRSIRVKSAHWSANPAPANP